MQMSMQEQQNEGVTVVSGGASVCGVKMNLVKEVKLSLGMKFVTQC